MDNKADSVNKKTVVPGKAPDRAKVEAAIDRIRPSLQQDGGDVELVDISGGTVKLRLKGHCAGCPMSAMTLKNGIERILKQEIPEVKEVISA